MIAGTAAIFLLLAALVPIAAAPARSAPNLADVVRTYADIAEAGYEDLLAAAKKLQGAVDARIAKPTPASLNKAREAWLAARVPYQQTEAYRFGNAIVDESEGKVNAWPLDEGLIDYVSRDYGAESEENSLYTANVIANRTIRIDGVDVDVSTITKALIAETLQEAGGIEANVASGYHAIEFLLWGQDLNGTGPGAGNRPASDFDPVNCTGGNCARRAQYLKAATDLLVDDLTWMAAQWAPAGKARTTLQNTPGEELPGGSATSRKVTQSRNAFSHSSGNIGFEGELEFKIGNAMFRKVWVSAPASTHKSDGLGPLYNARSCQGCHFKDGRGHPPAANWPDDDDISMFLRLSIPPQTDEQRRLLAEHRINVVPEPTYGGQLQDHAVQGHAIEGRMHIDYEEVPVTLGDGETVTLRKPSYHVTDLGYGPLHPDTLLSPRIAPQMIGLGLLEAVPESVVMENADPDDKDDDGISGRANRVWSAEKKRVMLGRFGWKAGVPSILEQSAGAFAGDIGISSWLSPTPAGDCTEAQDVCRGAPDGRGDGEEEIGRKLLGLVVRYASNLAVPKRRNPADPAVLQGKALFGALGCAGCHHPRFETGKHESEAHLSQQTIWPYTDLLLHDMGDGLADGRPEGVASGREWRTAPLWGIGLTKQVSGHTYFLHDGRARNVTEAILWHGGEAQPSRDAFAALTKEERDRLIAFLTSL